MGYRSCIHSPHCDSLLQDCCTSSSLAMEILQSYIKPSQQRWSNNIRPVYCCVFANSVSQTALWGYKLHTENVEWKFDKEGKKATHIGVVLASDLWKGSLHMVYMKLWNGMKTIALQWRHNDHDGVSNHHPYDCLPNRIFRCRSKKTSKPRVTGLCEENSPVIGEFPAQRVSNAENVFIWWRHHGYL